MQLPEQHWELTSHAAPSSKHWLMQTFPAHTREQHCPSREQEAPSSPQVPKHTPSGPQTALQQSTPPAHGAPVSPHCSARQTPSSQLPEQHTPSLSHSSPSSKQTALPHRPSSQTPLQQSPASWHGRPSSWHAGLPPEPPAPPPSSVGCPTRASRAPHAEKERRKSPRARSRANTGGAYQIGGSPGQAQRDRLRDCFDGARGAEERDPDELFAAGLARLGEDDEPAEARVPLLDEVSAARGARVSEVRGAEVEVEVRLDGGAPRSEVGVARPEEGALVRETSSARRDGESELARR
jgi:hypothetical protein